MTNEKPTYYTILPAEVRFNKNLSPYARLLYSDIVVLSQQKGYCYAGNTAFANYYDVAKETISKWIADLIKHGYLSREVIRDSNNQIIERRLYIEDLGINPTIDTPNNPTVNTHKSSDYGGVNPTIDTPNNPTVNTHKSSDYGGVNPTINHPINPTVKESITSITNNTSINNIVGQEEPEEKERIPYKEIIDHLNEKAGKSFNSKAAGNKKLIRARWNEGYRVDDFKKVIDNMVVNWTGQMFNGKPAAQYLQPSTLFGNKFDKYLNQVPYSNNTGVNDDYDYRKEIYGMTQKEIEQMNSNKN